MCILTIYDENPLGYMSQCVFSKKPVILRNGRLQSTMESKNSSDFVLQLNKYLFIALKQAGFVLAVH